MTPAMLGLVGALGAAAPQESTSCAEVTGAVRADGGRDWVREIPIIRGRSFAEPRDGLTGAWDKEHGVPWVQVGDTWFRYDVQGPSLQFAPGSSALRPPTVTSVGTTNNGAFDLVLGDQHIPVRGLPTAWATENCDLSQVALPPGGVDQAAVLVFPRPEEQGTEADTWKHCTALMEKDQAIMALEYSGGALAQARPFHHAPLVDVRDAEAVALDSFNNAWGLYWTGDSHNRAFVKISYSGPNHRVREVALDPIDLGQIDDDPDEQAYDRGTSDSLGLLLPMPRGRMLVVLPSASRPGFGLSVFLFDPVGQDACLVSGSPEATRAPTVIGAKREWNPLSDPISHFALYSIPGDDTRVLLRDPGEGEPQPDRVLWLGGVVHPPTPGSDGLKRVHLDGVRALLRYMGASWQPPDVVLSANSKLPLDWSGDGWAMCGARPATDTGCDLDSFGTLALYTRDIGDVESRHVRLAFVVLPAWPAVTLAMLLMAASGLLATFLFYRLNTVGNRHLVAQAAAGQTGAGFVSGQPSPAFFFGRVDILREILHALAHGKIVCIGGPARTGKSWTVHFTHLALRLLAGSLQEFRELPLSTHTLLARRWKRSVAPVADELKVPTWFSERRCLSVRVSWNADQTEARAWSVLARDLRHAAESLYRERTLNEDVAEAVLAFLGQTNGDPRIWVMEALRRCEPRRVRVVIVLSEAVGVLLRRGESDETLLPSGAGRVLQQVLAMPSCTALLEAPHLNAATALLSLLPRERCEVIDRLPPLNWWESFQLLRTLTHVAPRRPGPWCALRIAWACRREPYVMQRVGALVLDRQDRLPARTLTWRQLRLGASALSRDDAPPPTLRALVQTWRALRGQSAALPCRPGTWAALRVALALKGEVELVAPFCERELQSPRPYPSRSVGWEELRLEVQLALMDVYSELRRAGWTDTDFAGLGPASSTTTPPQRL